MVAPAGPVSAEAFKFTLLKLPEGACTTTCVSTVSPRALDRLMEEAVPAVSVAPTLSRLGATQTVNVGGITAFTVRVAALLVTLPAMMLTAAVNWAPLSELVVVGVVWLDEVAPLIATPFFCH